MEPKKFRITLGYLNGDMNIPNNKNVILFLDSRKMKFETSNNDSWNFSNRIDAMHLRLFPRKVYRMLITINMKRDIAFVQSIIAPAVLRKGLPRIIDILSSSGISRITKSVKIVTFATTTGTSSQIQIGIAVDLSAMCKDISVGVNLFKSSLRYKERGITLTPATRSHKAVLT